MKNGKGGNMHFSSKKLIQKLKNRKENIELVNLFQAEYKKDYLNALKCKETIDGQFVKDFLRNQLI
ncbi:MAG: hypothetical protein WD512_11215 [Candidatus Paceibacterota bacterium]